VDQKRVTHFIPRQRDPFIARIETLCPKITRVTGFAELRVGNGIAGSRSSALIAPTTVDCSQRAIAMLSE
jgi:hypothetical protein